MGRAYLKYRAIIAVIREKKYLEAENMLSEYNVHLAFPISSHSGEYFGIAARAYAAPYKPLDSDPTSI